MDAVPYLAGLSAILALALAFLFYKLVKSAPPGNDLMVRIMTEIQSGARAFLKQEYTWVAGFVVIMAVLIPVLTGVELTFISYILGAALSASAGYVGMKVATMANARTTQAASEGPAKALPLAFRGGAVMGFSVAGLSLLGLAFTYLLFVEWLTVDDPFEIFTAFGLGASSIALFSRVGGGIYTKAADVGGDLVGKVEAGIPEDDPRNPATIADAVGDNVGDVAGMGADLFESYSGSIIAPIALTAFSFAVAGSEATGSDIGLAQLMFPLAVAFVGMLAAIVGSFAVRGSAQADVKSLSRQLHMGTNVAMGLTVVGTILVGLWFFTGDEFDGWWGLPISVIGGLAVGWAIGKVAEIWTSDHYPPVRKIAQQSETGPATTVLSGISAGMVSVAASVILIGAGVLVAYWGGQQTLGDTTGAGIYGIAVAAIGMLATTGVVVSVDAYGPIADNAGGIAEMSKLDPKVRDVTDALDSLGNTTAAIAKGFAVGSAALTALALFKTFEVALQLEDPTFVLSLDVGKVDVFIGLFLGAMLPFLFAALTIDAVGRAANKMIEEVRRQFREIPGLREGAEGVKPDSARCVAISTQASLREMLVPGALAVAVPLILGFIDVDTLGGFLAGALVTGFALAIFMANAGGAWDNAKKYIEAGAHGGKGSEPHKAAVVGDTVGDPFKDTSGPSMNILIKVMTIVSLVFASAFV
ncbi:sodium-translocating pyrophosphatase [Candidatus Poriferisocius sp.]|uniref:sodium-translocating pyrophosphatase n=1 Tax=Candidatus Poriferisocius sp. TaxID=3101276 RepID=UPI003B0289C1